MKKLVQVLCRDKLEACLRLEATAIRKFHKTTELLPDFDLVSYAGLTDKDYPIWHEFDFSDDAVFVHRLILDDYGYDVDVAEHDDPNYEMPKETSESGGQLKLEVHSTDRFGCRAMIRGSLYGTSMEMNMDVRFKFLMACYSAGSPRIGYAAEAIAEGFAFESEGKLKQAFFSYFAALDSFLESERESLNAGLSAAQQIPADIRMIEKLRPIIKASLPPTIAGLDKISLWGDVKNGFDKSEKLRNAIAHNTKTQAITRDDVDLCFCVLAVIVAMVRDGHYDEKAIKAHYS